MVVAVKGQEEGILIKGGVETQRGWLLDDSRGDLAKPPVG